MARPLRIRTDAHSFLDAADYVRYCAPDATFEAGDLIYTETFLEAMTRLARGALAEWTGTTVEAMAAPPAACARLLVVTHREGIRDLCEAAGSTSRKTPYCCVARFHFHTADGSWALVSKPTEGPTGNGWPARDPGSSDGQP